VTTATVGPVRVVIQGLGLLGRTAIELCADTPGAQLVAVVTRRPQAVSGIPPEVEVLTDLQSVGSRYPGAVVLSTVHAIDAELESVLAEAARAGLDVVTSSGLFHPRSQLADGGVSLDAEARQHGIRVFSSGVQPGFVLDALPAMLLDLAPGWTGVEVTKPSDARSWPQSVRHMLGIGELPDFVESSVPYPLAASARLIGDAVGRQVVNLVESRSARTSAHDIVLPEETVRSGNATGFVHECRAQLEDGRSVRVRWEPSIDITAETDLSLLLEADGGSRLRMRLDGSFRDNPYPATAARMLHIAMRGRALPPGLHTVLTPGLVWPHVSVRPGVS
jgi:hypothetical protein